MQQRASPSLLEPCLPAKRLATASPPAQCPRAAPPLLPSAAAHVADLAGLYAIQVLPGAQAPAAASASTPGLAECFCGPPGEPQTVALVREPGAIPARLAAAAASFETGARVRVAPAAEAEDVRWALGLGAAIPVGALLLEGAANCAPGCVVRTLPLALLG